MTPKNIQKVPTTTVTAKKMKPSLTKTMQWQDNSLTEAINEVNTFIRNKGNFSSSEKGKMNNLMKKAEKMLKMGAFGNLDNLLEREVQAYRPGMFGQSHFKGYKEVNPSEIVDGKYKQVSGQRARDIARIRGNNPNAGMKPGVKTTIK